MSVEFSIPVPARPRVQPQVEISDRQLLMQRLDQMISLLRDIKIELSKEDSLTADWLPTATYLVTLTTSGTTYQVVANLTGRTKVYRVQNTSLGSIYYGSRNPLSDTESPILAINEKLKFVIPNGYRLYMRPTAASLTVIVEDLY